MRKRTSKEFARARLEGLIRERLSVSYMSDSKWVRLLHALANIGDRIKCCKVKLVWDESIRTMRIDPRITYDFDYYRHAMESMISGLPTGIYAYKELEWIEFPSDVQDIESIAAHIQSVGEFQLERRESGLRLCAYG